MGNFLEMANPLFLGSNFPGTFLPLSKTNLTEFPHSQHPQPWFYPYINTFRSHNNANEYFCPRFIDEKTGAKCGLVACLKVTQPVNASQDPNTGSGAPGSALLTTSLYIYGLKWEKGDGDPWQEISPILKFYFNSTNNWEISTARQWFRHQTQFSWITMEQGTRTSAESYVERQKVASAVRSWDNARSKQRTKQERFCPDFSDWKILPKIIIGSVLSRTFLVPVI